jgi:oligoribonuclease NrnB/cAMP/cGMP phosphodiesterase (DHH superfamily)
MSMRNLILTVIIILFYAQTNAQAEKKSFFLLYHNNSKIKKTESKNDTINIELFTIDFNKVNIVTYQISIDKFGNLSKRIQTKPIHEKIFEFSYTNSKSNNIPILISKNAIVNSLDYDEIISKVKSDDFLKILNNFNVYFINADLSFEDYYLAKKVKFEKGNSRL